MQENLKIKTKTFQNSSLILRADYDPILESLKLYFQNGSVYEYCAVPEKYLEDLSSAESVGKFFHTQIKGKFEALKR
jgi:hypothetical protein